MVLERSRILAVMDVLDHHHADEGFVLAVVVEGELDQPLQRLQRRQVLDVQLAFALPDGLVGVLERAEIEAFLVAEIVVDHALAGAGAGRDLVDPGARQAVQRELLRRDLDDVLAASPRDPACGSPRPWPAALSFLALIATPIRRRRSGLIKLTSSYIVAGRGWIHLPAGAGQTQVMSAGAAQRRGVVACNRMSKKPADLLSALVADRIASRSHQRRRVPS